MNAQLQVILDRYLRKAADSDRRISDIIERARGKRTVAVPIERLDHAIELIEEAQANVRTMRALVEAMFEDGPLGPFDLAPDLGHTEVRETPRPKVVDVGDYGEQLAAKGGVIDPELERQMIKYGGVRGELVKWCAMDCPCRRIHVDLDRLGAAE